MFRRSAILAALVTAIIGPRLSAAGGADQVGVVAGVPPQEHSDLYIANRAPLVPSRLMKLPIGSITPRGWLRHQLELEAQGMTGRLAEISPWCRFEGSAWTDPNGKGYGGWEEMPYWLKGYGDLGYVLKDEKIIHEARRWIEAILATQTADGWFGPVELRTSLDGKPDLWPHMLVLNVLQSYYEQSSDPRVLAFMARYFRWELDCPDKDFLTGYWPPVRGGDNLESIYWLYNRTGEEWLLKVAEKVHRHTANWTAGVANWHGVNITQGFREPAIFFPQAGDRAKYLDAAERNYQTVMGLYGQMPGGGFGADENCRPGYGDPRQGFETCSIVEFMHSFEMLTKISGEPRWSDRCEELAFNTLPAALTADWRALHYLTSPNMVQLDRQNKSPGIQNGGTMLSYSPFEVYRCCQHNVSHGWPYFAEELWLATADRGLCASLYAPSEVTAKVADGQQVTISEETDYPFGDTIKLRVATPKPVKFPLYLRVPGWCEVPSISDVVEGPGGTYSFGDSIVPIAPRPAYFVLNRQWSDGITIRLHLPMHLAVRTWKKNHDSVSVDYGPLTFSLTIGEQYKRYGREKGDFTEQEVFPTSTWNYGLVLDPHKPAASFKIEHGRHDGSPPPQNPRELPSVESLLKPEPLSEQPFTPETAPIRILVTARRIPAWRTDAKGLVGKLQNSPVRSDEPLERIALIPMGCARLRITAFPKIGDGPDAHDWSVPTTVALASHCFANDTVEALNDGILPKNSGDETIPRFTWWDHRGTTEWVEYDYPKPQSFSTSEVYWFDDTGHGSCRVPKSWRLLYKDGDAWKPVATADAYGTTRDQFNTVKFAPLKTTAIRLETELQPNFSGGILEWRVN